MEKLIILVPLITGYITTAVCKMSSDAGSSVSFRPPAAVFGIIWPILYLLLGYSWYRSLDCSIYYSLLVLSLCSWLVIYSCLNNKGLAIFNLLICVVLSLMVYTCASKVSKYTIVPLIGWLLFALLLNMFEVNNLSLNSTFSH